MVMGMVIILLLVTAPVVVGAVGVMETLVAVVIVLAVVVVIASVIIAIAVAMGIVLAIWAVIAAIALVRCCLCLSVAASRITNKQPNTFCPQMCENPNNSRRLRRGLLLTLCIIIETEMWHFLVIAAGA